MSQNPILRAMSPSSRVDVSFVSSVAACLGALGCSSGGSPVEVVDDAVREACRIIETRLGSESVLELGNGRISVVIAPRLGGRILQLRLDDFEYLWTNPDLERSDLASSSALPAADSPAAAPPSPAPPSAEAEGLGTWANPGGDKLWPAPQGWSGPEEWPGPPDPAPLGGCTDSREFAVEILERGPEAAAVRLVGPKDLYAGIRFTRVVRIRSRSTLVELESVMENITEGASRRTVRWGVWQVTQHAASRGGGAPLLAWAPVNPQSRWPRGYRILFGPEDNPQFSVVPESGIPGGRVAGGRVAGGGVAGGEDAGRGDTGRGDAGRGVAGGADAGRRDALLFRLDYTHRVGKAVLDAAEGWLAVEHPDSGHLFVHTFDPRPEEAHPDEASIEFWTSGPGEIQLGDRRVALGEEEPWLVESEVVSPYARLEPGESYRFDAKFGLVRARGPVLGVSGSVAILNPIGRTASGAFTGSLGFFDDGELHGISASSVDPPTVSASRIEGPSRLLVRVRAGTTLRLEDLPPRAVLERLEYRTLDGRVLAAFPGGG